MMKRFLLTLLALVGFAYAHAGERFNFNAGWKVKVGADSKAFGTHCDDSGWECVTLPHSFNQSEAFSRAISDLTDTVAWYRKSFRLPKGVRGKKYFIEFEGVRQAARVFCNGKELGWHENGVMAFGFDLTPYIRENADNVIAVFIDNNWRYRERASRSGFQWNDKNFNCNYGGINKNVWFHVMNSDVYQTLPLFSNLQTTGVYVYAKDFDIESRKATIHAESEVMNESPSDVNVSYEFELLELDGRSVASYSSKPVTVKSGGRAVVAAEGRAANIHFWSWGYGYLYDVETRILVNGKVVDRCLTRTGFRKTEFRDGMVFLNDRVLQLKGFAQRTTNEWPAVGISIPAWMSDYSNGLVLGCNGNLFRWMHVCPSKQDVRSFDRLGLIQAMPAGDSEKDVEGRRWEQRTEVMRDAIIYNRNNPSILFYESGNNEISEEHMLQMLALRKQFDPFGGRAIGSRNMNGSRLAEYGGEMLYINKSKGKPMWMMEYCRDEGIRRYWDEWSYPYHKEGDGPLFRGARAVSYNHNQDGLAVENIARWYEYWMARPGTGGRVCSGGAKIIFSDTNTHFRGEMNYRTSGDVDPMRIPKDSYFVHRVMWNGWVDTDSPDIHIVGHWNYDADVVKPVYVASNTPQVELLLNGKSLGFGVQSNHFLFTFADVKWLPGSLVAIGRDESGRELCRCEVRTAGEPSALRVHWIEAPDIFRADGADIRIAEIEAVDSQGQRCPLAHDRVSFSLSGPATWLGGVSANVADSLDNRILATSLDLEAGVCRVMIRSTLQSGVVKLSASATGLPAASLSTTSVACPVSNGFYTDSDGNAIQADWAALLPCNLQRGETPVSPSFSIKFRGVEVSSIDVPCDSDAAFLMVDDDDMTKWESDGLLQNAWATFHLERKASIRQIVLRLADFRKASYPLEVVAGGRVVFSGYTPKSLGFVYLDLQEAVESDSFTIRMIGPATLKEAFADMTELAAKRKVSTKASKSEKLSILNIEFNE